LSRVDEIAVAEMSCVAADGTKFDARIAVCRPYRATTGEWRCPMAMSGLQEALPDMAGEDSLQALCMALSTARSLLEHFVEQGGQLFYRGNDSRFDIAATFGHIGQSDSTRSRGLG
jgi:uncharacterized protein DUF6968